MVRITQNILLRRINRRWAPNMEQLHKTQGTRWQLELGEYYIKDHRRNALVAHHVDPEQLDRELGVLKDYEQVT